MTIENTYTHLTPHEHVLYNPAMYIGNTNETQSNIWLSEDSKSIIQKQVMYNAGLYKIFDEILSNAYDHTQRAKSCNVIKVRLSDKKITIFNNGTGIDVVKHKEYGMYIPEFVFGKMMTSTNYTTESRTAIGVNGMGAVLTNIFSKKFMVITYDSKRRLLYKQTFRDNMKVREEPIIESIDKDEKLKPYTQITFYPDFERFNVNYFSPDMISVFRRRVMDIAGCTKKNITVELIEEEIDNPPLVKVFKEYVNIHDITLNGHVNPSNIIHDQGTWDVAFAFTPNGGFQQVSLVNANNTILGGTHVDYIVDQINKHVCSIIKKKLPNIQVRGLKEHLTVFVSCYIENPSFNTQSKDQLITKCGSFSSKHTISDTAINKLIKSGLIKHFENLLKSKEIDVLDKKNKVNRSSISAIPNLDDAHMAGKQPDKCKLFLTEGLSAKPFAISGLSVIGRKHYGVFPLKGKLLNVRDAPVKRILESKEVQAIKSIMGLKDGMVYTDVSELRYGGIVALCDADYDGYHIVGLIMNFLNTFWPSLLKLPGFYCTMMTPIVKVSGKINKTFYYLSDYEKWCETNDSNKYKVKYYKGLGTSTITESKECFKDFDNLLLTYQHMKNREGYDVANDLLSNSYHNDQSAIELAFDKKHASVRKDWLATYNSTVQLSRDINDHTLSDFVHKMLIHFSNDDVTRSIPFVGDGLKPSQRKIIYACVKRNLYKTEMKVAQFSGSVAEIACYHHGEASLNSAIIQLARDFVGTNNVNILQPIGMFGTRENGGKDSASPRYIFTRFSDIVPYIFRKDDTIALDYNVDDGQSIEPVFYAPIVPMILINGAHGIGTGYSTNIPNYNIVKVIKALKCMINNEEPESLYPSYNKFKGTIESDGCNGYNVYGCFEITKTGIIITELPIDVWTDDYKEFLHSLRLKGEYIKTIVNDGDIDNIKLKITLLDDMSDEKIYDVFKLRKHISISNLHAFSYSTGVIHHYDSPEEIMTDFYNFRKKMYIKRKKLTLEQMEKEIELLSAKVKFIRCVINKTIIVGNKSKCDIITQIEDNDIPMIENSYEYLLTLPIYSLTRERKEKLENQLDVKLKDLDLYKVTTIRQMWINELDELLYYINNKK